MSYVFASKTGIKVQHIMSLQESKDNLKVHVNWKLVQLLEDAVKRVHKIF